MLYYPEENIAVHFHNNAASCISLIVLSFLHIVHLR